MSLKQRIGGSLEGTQLFDYAVQANRTYEYVLFRLESLLSDETVVRVGNARTAFQPQTAEEWRNVRRRIDNERPVLEHLQENVEPGDVFWDVGANVGAYSCLVSEFVPTGKVVAFEPYPPNVSLLRKNVAHNDATNVLIETTALSDEHDTAEFFVPRTSEGGAQEGTTASRLADDVANVVTVTTAPGDDIVKQSDVPRPNVIKIDIEGSGPAALRGLETTLQRDDCRLIYAEPHSNANELRELLRTSGFEISTIELYRSDDDEGTIVARK